MQKSKFINKLSNNSASNLISLTKKANQIVDELDPEKQNRFPNLFRFTDITDAILIILGTIGSFMVGSLDAINFMFQGNMLNNFKLPPSQLMASMVTRFYYFVGTGFLQLIGGFLMYLCWTITGYRQAKKCRVQYLEAIFRQQIGWFETQDQSKIFTQFISDCHTFEQAISEKMAIFLFILSTFVTRIIVSLIVVWQLSLMLIGLILIIAVIFIVTELIDRKYNKNVLQKAIEATARTEETLSCIQTVKALNGQQFELSKYSKFLELVKQQQFKLGLSNGLSSGIMFFVIYCLFALGLFYGLFLISVQTTSSYSSTGFVTIGDIFVPIFLLGIAVFVTLQFKATIKKIKDGLRALNRISKIIDRHKINEQQFLNPGKIPDEFKGHFLLKNVSFSYPSQPDRLVLNKVTINFDKNKSALVGFSGSGKSTIFQLLIKLYQPTEGTIYLDGVDIKQIDTKWLRKQIGYVTQEAFFFTGTLRQNFLVSNPKAKDSQIYDALKVAEIFDAVQTLEQKLDTKISMNANQFSGGQKQRLSIAKALLRNPKMLLLDEPTSSLDRKTEAQIQKNLDRISQKIKSISIAHRVSTIKGCDKIIFMKQGKVVQQGKFKDLIKFQSQITKKKTSIKRKNTIMHQIGQIKSNSSIQQYVLLKRQSSMQQIDSINSPNKLQNNSVQINPLQLVAELLRNFQKQNLVNAQQSDQQPSEMQEQKNKPPKQQQKQYEASIYGRIFILTNQKLPLLIIAFILCIPIGLAPSFIGKLMGQLIAAGIQMSGEALRQVSNRQSLIIFIIGLAFFIAKFFQSFLFTICGSNITYQMRNRVYQKILRMPVSWHGEINNSVTNLSQFLDKDCQKIRNLITISIGIVIQVVVVTTTSLIISFIYQYRVSFIVLAVLPPILIINLIQVRINGNIAKQMQSIDEDSNSLLRQSIVNAKIILSNCFEDLVINKYKKNIYVSLSLITKKGVYSGFLYGLSVFLLVLVLGSQYIVMGAVLIQNPNINLTNVIVPVFAMNICFIFMTYLFHFMPDIGEAKRSAIRAFTILDQQDQLQMQQRQKSKMLVLNPKQLQKIQLRNVTFRYPNRTENVLQNANLTIVKGSHYNIIGRSGCGKSTLFKILLRFYEPTEESEITINETNIKQYDIKQLRKLFGLVSQQPMLFTGTIEQNICYSIEGKSKDDIQQAARLSNSLQFIKGQKTQRKETGKVRLVNRINFEQYSKLCNLGYGKEVGIKGNQLSGGQRQRISIARVLLRNPQFYLFDESTSALDQQTQSIVQSNFKEVLKGKTSLSITHNFKQHQGKSIIIIQNNNFTVVNPIENDK